VALRRARKAALTAKALPLAKDGQGHHLAPAEGGRRSRVTLRGHGGLAKVIDPNVKSSEEGVDIDHEIAPYLGEERAILQAEGTFRSTVSCQLTPSV
jgi:hypothetical protein